MRPQAPPRPEIRVVVTASGRGDSEQEARAAADAIDRRPGDAIAVAETAGGDLGRALNEAAARGTEPWLLFLAAGVRPRRDILDAYFGDPVGERCGAVVGGDDRGVVSGGDDARNLLVRRTAWAEVGGFQEGVGAGAAAELRRRLERLGWKVAERGAARVGGERPPGIATALREAAAWGAVRRWLRRRDPGARAARVAHRSRLADSLCRLADGCGYAAGRVAIRRERPAPARDRPAVVVMTDAYPARSETFVYNEVGALGALGWRVRVESSARPARIEPEAARATEIAYLEDDPPLAALADLIRLGLRHPLGCCRDLVARRRWRKEEQVWPLRTLAPAARRLASAGERHLHVHFAAGAALHAARLSRITGVTYSVVGHGYDVFREPRNLGPKLAGAAFAIGPCEYTAAHMRQALAPADGGRVKVVVMGVDGARFRRRSPYPGGRTVIAIGRLVAKKGFADLVEAAALLARTAPLDRVLIVGDGDERGSLERLIDRLELADTVEIVGGAWGADGVKPLLERSDLLAMPAVIAPDGDRDAMPVVVKEALAMEVPVVASDLVGLPELVRPQWGRLVPPADPVALADAIEGLLALPPARRAEMGRAGRAHVLAHCALAAETAKLAELIGSATAAAAGRGPN